MVNILSKHGGETFKKTAEITLESHVTFQQPNSGKTIKEHEQEPEPQEFFELHHTGFIQHPPYSGFEYVLVNLCIFQDLLGHCCQNTTVFIATEKLLNLYLQPEAPKILYQVIKAHPFWELIYKKKSPALPISDQLYCHPQFSEKNKRTSRFRFLIKFSKMFRKFLAPLAKSTLTRLYSLKNREYVLPIRFSNRTADAL